MGVIEPIEGLTHLRLHLLGAGIALVKVDALGVELVEQVIPDDAGIDAGNGDLRAVVADAGVANLGRHVDKVAHNVLKTGGGGAFVRKPH